MLLLTLRRVSEPPIVVPPPLPARPLPLPPNLSASSTTTAAVYVGNYEYDASERELERMFEKYGEVDRVEYKSGAYRRVLPTTTTMTTRPCLPRQPGRRCRQGPDLAAAGT